MHACYGLHAHIYDKSPECNENGVVWESNFSMGVISVLQQITTCYVQHDVFNCTCDDKIRVTIIMRSNTFVTKTFQVRIENLIIV